jgi:hypothetical protein
LPLGKSENIDRNKGKNSELDKRPLIIPCHPFVLFCSPHPKSFAGHSSTNSNPLNITSGKKCSI